jgi:hypothetical protein
LVADPTVLVTTILTALRTIPGITVYDGFVPTSVPMTGTYINPYIVLWAGNGDEPDELTADGVQDGGSLVFDFQTTVVGANPGVCRTVTKAAKAKLTNLQAGTGRVRRNPDGFNQQSPILDTQTSPARFLLPLQWRLITN